MTTYVISERLSTGGYRWLATFAGPHRLAKWQELPAGCEIEEFVGSVSRGTVSLDYVRRHAAMESR